LGVSTQQAASSGTRRRYESARRLEQAAQTRVVVLEAAIRLFGERGWASTGMRDVARAAGVSVETVYAYFGSKPDLLLAALDMAVVGDTEAVPLEGRPGFAEIGRGRAAARARAAAHLLREVHERTAGVGKALREAAASDADLAARLASAEANRRHDVEQAGQLVAGRPITDVERDGLWAVTSIQVYELLVDLAGWTPADYEVWMADTIGRLLRPGKGGS
jgi:AcrR family transcriptional regulator